ncbi:MAG TPA: hypothetical protein VGM09_23820 [Bradyrhizobium sp.]
MPKPDPDDEPAAGTANVVGTVEVGTLNGSDAGTDRSVVAEGVAGTVFSGAGAACGLVWAGLVCAGSIWAFAAPTAASHRIIADAKMRCIASSFSSDID